VAGTKIAVADEETARKNGLGNPKKDRFRPVVDVAGTFGGDPEESIGERERFAL